MCACMLLQVDSGFFCEGYSSDEDVLVKEEFRGNIVKQGCLLKQVNTPNEMLHFVALLHNDIHYVVANFA